MRGPTVSLVLIAAMAVATPSGAHVLRASFHNEAAITDAGYVRVVVDDYCQPIEDARRRFLIRQGGPTPAVGKGSLRGWECTPFDEAYFIKVHPTRGSLEPGDAEACYIVRTYDEGKFHSELKQCGPIRLYDEP